MKILMTNWRLTWFSGSDTYLLTLGKELLQRGHIVHIFTEHAGLAARYFEDAGIKVLDTLPEKSSSIDLEQEYDVIHGHHHSTMQLVDSRFPDVPKIFVCHGILPQLETPPSGVTIQKYVAVSEETQEKRLKEEFGKQSEIIRQPVNLEQFSPPKDFIFRKEKIRIVVISNYFGISYPATEVWEAVKSLDAELTVIGPGGIMTNDPSQYIKQADIVISLGRGIVEAMACGKPVIVGDYNGYDGAILNEEEYLNIRKCNFSGRYKKTNPKEKGEWDNYPGEYIIHEVGHLLDEGLEKVGNEMRQLAEKYHDVKKIADRFEEIYTEISKK